MDLAEVLRTTGRGDDAASAATEALGLYERKGSVVSADLARAFLAHGANAVGARARRAGG